MENISELQNEAENYFLHTNYMNKRILQDVIHVRESYEDTWNHLNQKDREQAINDEIILPEVVLKHEQRGPEIISFPQLRIKSGQNIILDEDLKSGEKIKYRDEHSGPFSWKTRSQQDLNLSLSMVDPAAVDRDGYQLVAARRSAILSCPFGQYSKIPKAAKPVSIPVVPNVNKPLPETTKENKKESGEDIYIPSSVNQSISHSTNRPITQTINPPKVEQTADSESTDNLVFSSVNQPEQAVNQPEYQSTNQPETPSIDKSAAQPNNQSTLEVGNSPQHTPRSLEDVTSMVSSIVISQEDNLVLDFSRPLDYAEGSSLSTGSSTPRDESSGLLNKMKEIKERTMSLKRSLTPTMRRKKSTSSVDTGSMMLSMSSGGSAELSDLSPNKTKIIRAVSCNRPSAPPPPPPSCTATPPPQSNNVTPQSNVGPPPSQLCNTISVQPPGGSPLRRAGPTAQPAVQPPGGSPLRRAGPPAPPARDPQTRISCRDLSAAEIVDRDQSSDTEIVAEETDSVHDENGDVHKTGFDFLDDW